MKNLYLTRFHEPIFRKWVEDLECPGDQERFIVSDVYEIFGDIRNMIKCAGRLTACEGMVVTYVPAVGVEGVVGMELELKERDWKVLDVFRTEKPRSYNIEIEFAPSEIRFLFEQNLKGKTVYFRKD